MHSLFDLVDVFFNSKPFPPNNSYAYRAYIETLLNYGPEAKYSHLTTVLWSDDSAGKMDDATNDNTRLAALRKLLNYYYKSVDLIGQLHCDVFRQEKLLLNSVEVSVCLLRPRNKFSLIDPSGYLSVCIEGTNLIIWPVKIIPGVLLAHAKTVSKSTAKYPLTRIEFRAVPMHSSIHGATFDNIVLG